MLKDHLASGTIVAEIPSKSNSEFDWRDEK